jgi:hypothetical protein
VLPILSRQQQLELLAEEGRAEEEREREKQRQTQMKSTKASGDSLRSIVKAYGVMPLAKLINDENNALGISEAEFLVFAGEHASAKGMTLGKLLNTNSGEGAMLAKAAAICRYAGYSKQAQQNLGDARIRARAAQLG